ncbi:CocE/NonD family hydrolase [Pseudohongiella sp.]|uniref:Xaa-Pro dipeptidyl-peptidase C-terminal domain-containing protein n=1 Tax=marine sediment metagenome TaxID=412755 RepID=A0A0F9YJI0_9ZZZZ|nr:CocE/NonD family hydrolase [Pseudohongiella sp.]HDZ07558.1 CocE/NonD family hydrolase [Pseudohongiella sp.]HEA64346.1 CocE/NonD family hydrolase [Pseudohongiella sp.]
MLSSGHPCRLTRRLAPRLAIQCLVALMLSCGLAAGHAQPLTPDNKTIVMVPMRDGIQLATNVYLPDGDGPWPVILTRTPYDKDGIDRSVAEYNTRGYAVVSQDVRGRYDSEGENQPFENDIEDGYDTVEWIAAQNFSDGNVGIFGTSAPGITSNLAAAAAPPHLTAAYVTVAPDSLFYRSRFVGGVFKESHSGGWLRGQGVSEEAINAYKARAVLDDQWRATDFLFHRDNVEIPVYNVGGWHDIYAEGSLHNFVYLQNDGNPQARGKQKLFMGAFGHGVLQGDLEYPGGGMINGDLEEQFRWWDYWLKDIDNGIMDEPPVSIYMMASARKGNVSDKNRVIHMDSWPPQNNKTRYYLQPDMGLSVEPPAVTDASKTYTFDPTNPVPTMGGQNLGADVGPRDQRDIGQRQDYLRFSTPVLQEDVVVAGHIDMELFVATDALDTDFVVKLVDIYPDGYEALILDYPIRARFRNGQNPGDVELMTPGAVEQLIINMWSTAQTFEAGHRIGVHVTSSNYPRFAVNPNNGAALDDSSTPAQEARNTIYFDANRPSSIVLPVVTAPLD